jgi:hypothetical protein
MAHAAAGVEATIRGFGNTLDGVMHAPNLALLRMVDQTVDTLVSEQKIVAGFEQTGRGLIQALKDCQSKLVIDPDGILSEQLLSAETAMKARIEDCQRRRQAAFADPMLRGDHESAVVSEYDRTMALWRSLYDATAELRWAVMESDADLETPIPAEAESLESLISSLKA